MRIAYFDCFSGVSGDKTLGALVDLGVPVELIETELAKLPLSGYELEAFPVTKLDIASMRVKVHVFEQKVVRTWTSVRMMLEDSDLSDAAKEGSLAVFGELAAVESKLHAKPIESVHFHEVGAVDSIVDVVGTVVGLDHLGVVDCYSSPVPTGTGMIRTEHGMLPIPAPATAELLCGIPTYSTSMPTELTTPTGAAILKTLVSHFGEMPPLVPEAIGYGAAKRDLQVPNVLRLIVGELLEQPAEPQRVVVIETNVDNTSPELLGSVVDQALEMGALDVWQTPVYMKKGRSGTLLSVLCDEQSETDFIDLLMRETNTLGVRRHPVTRTVAAREIVKIRSSLGTARIKVGRFRGQVTSVSPEHDDCVRLAKKTGLAVKEVHERLKLEAMKKLGAPASEDHERDA